jgi:hypothetical protein
MSVLKSKTISEQSKSASRDNSSITSNDVDDKCGVTSDSRTRDETRDLTWDETKRAHSAYIGNVHRDTSSR